MPKLEWEIIDDLHQRAKVFGGWLVKVYEGHYEYHVHQEQYITNYYIASMCFVPDPEYRWEAL